MNTKSKTFKVAPEFEDLFTFSTTEEKLEHRAQMISYRILSEIEKICEEKNIRRKDLASMVNTSASYITQLFRGDKHVNTQIMAKFEEALDVMFEFYLKKDDESHIECLTNLLTKINLDKKKLSNPLSMRNYDPEAKLKRTEELVEKMIQEDNSVIEVKLKKVAA